jgi:antitoxin component YwqK of YwqJK toxin-antitoxin module
MINDWDEFGKCGLWVNHFEDGSTHMEVSFKDGSKNGRCRIFWPYSGLVGYECFYKDDLIEGEEIGYVW